SQECPSCGWTQRENRRGEEFKCLHCNHEDNADIVGALNIRSRVIMSAYSPRLKQISA
ncbi:MAG: transposase, partial [SAR324 cluster bacterium]|nr:transposase [SAR324 cluster bacterium]